MRIFSIQSEFNTSFSAKKLPNINTGAVSKTELLNNMQLREAKVKTYLLEIIEKDMSLSMREISEQLGFKNIHVISRIIYQNPELKELWDKVMQITARKSDDIDERIKIFLEKVVKNKIPISANDIADEVGVSSAACRRRIRLNPVLKTLFEQRIEKPKSVKTIEAQDLEENIKQMLRTAIENSQFVLIKHMAEKFKLKYSQIWDRIRRTPDLLNLWNQLEHNKVPKKRDLGKS